MLADNIFSIDSVFSQCILVNLGNEVLCSNLDKTFQTLAIKAETLWVYFNGIVTVSQITTSLAST